MPSGRKSKAIRRLARKATHVHGDEAKLQEQTKFWTPSASASTKREIVIGKDMEGEDITIATCTLAYPVGSYKQVTKHFKKALA